MWWWRWTLGTVHCSIPRNLPELPCRTMKPTHPCSWEDLSDCHSASHWSWYLPATSTLCSTGRLKARRKTCESNRKHKCPVENRSRKYPNDTVCWFIFISLPLKPYALTLSMPQYPYQMISLPNGRSCWKSQKMEIMTQSLPTTLLDLEKKTIWVQSLGGKTPGNPSVSNFLSFIHSICAESKVAAWQTSDFFHCFNDPIILTKFGYKSSEPTSLSHHVRSLFKNPVSNIYGTVSAPERSPHFATSSWFQPRCRKDWSSSVHELPRRPLSFPVKVTVTIRRCLRPGIFPPFPHSSPPPTNLSAIVVDLDDPRGLQSEQPPLSSPVSSKS